MSAETYKIEGTDYRAIAVRNDSPWGHAIDVQIYRLDGTDLGAISYACHPEFAHFELYQSKTTEQLLLEVAQHLSSAVSENTDAWKAGFKIYVRLNGRVVAQPGVQADGL